MDTSGVKVETNARMSEKQGIQPLALFYVQLHDAIRDELGVIINLASDFLSADDVGGNVGDNTEYKSAVSILRTKYHYLEFVYKYHSTIEDEVLYPALESKIKNVTLAYSVEHEDEELLLEGLSALLAQAGGEDCAHEHRHHGDGETTMDENKREDVEAFVHGLARKVEEVDTTLRKHLDKEEAQLLPLLRGQFTIQEQSELVVQFMCCIPVSEMTRMLKWLFRSLDKAQRYELMEQVKGAIRDPLLKEILVHMWLAWQQPLSSVSISRTYSSRQVQMCCGGNAEKKKRAHPAEIEARGLAVMPLKKVIYFHEAIRSAMRSFAGEAKLLLNEQNEGSGEHKSDAQQSHLRALAERHRFIKSVCTFHASSEDDILFPLLRDVIEGSKECAGSSDTTKELDFLSHHCEEDHAAETARFDALGRLLGDVRSCARRGAKELSILMGELAGTAEKLSKSMNEHMAQEESDVFPTLMKILCPVEQRRMVWKLVQAMPLRLLERFMPWIARKIPERDMEEWLSDMNEVASREDSPEKPLVELLSRWAHRKLENSGNAEEDELRADNPAAFPIKTCGPQVEEDHALPEDYQRPKRIRVDKEANDGQHRRGRGNGIIATTSQDATTPDGDDGPIALVNPIDHIFQFHKALRSELKDLEKASLALQRAAVAAESWSSDEDDHEGSLNGIIADLQARFQFLRGVYKAHSRAEDEIVFPALESKEKLSNVSHAYSLDHEQEEQLLEDVSTVVADIESCIAERDLARLRSSTSKLSKMCAAIRASLETHVRAEEKELWPLFTEHFTIQEQEELVGQIIGQTGAEVLQVMLSWVTKAMTEDESSAMMMSLKTASKATAFENWLDAHATSNEKSGDKKKTDDASEPCGTVAPNASDKSPGNSIEEHQAILAEVAAYLVKHNMIPAGGGGGIAITESRGQRGAINNILESEPASLDATRFRPGWQEIFSMNQKHLQAAIRRVSADDSLEPQRKAYLIQHLMASRYIVAQQKRNPALGTPPSVASNVSFDTHFGCHGVHGHICGSRCSGVGGDGGGANGPPTAAPAPVMAHDPEKICHLTVSAKSFHDVEQGILGCKHYARKAMLVAPCCGREVVCRLCHDDELDHKMDRYQVKEMKCMECGLRQPVGQICSGCNAEVAKYYCGICHLLDDDTNKEIYHCPFCNFCRRGKGLGKDSFHCMSCNCCMSLELRKHDCSDNALSGTCPVCSERLFESSTPVKALPCGHFMHSLCFGAYVKYSYTCPICFKSLGDMEVYWKMLDAILAADRQQMVSSSSAGSARTLLESTQTVRCYDCEHLSQAPFHFVYHKCGNCGSFNTRIAE